MRFNFLLNNLCMYVELKLFLSRTLLILRDILLKIISVVKPKGFAENVFCRSRWQRDALPQNYAHKEISS